jgi:hypothetical protein
MGVVGAIFKVVGKPFMKSIPQGAATSVYAATAPDLAGKSGSYLSNCAVAKPTAEGRDDAIAEKLWAVSERLVGSGATAAN